MALQMRQVHGEALHGDEDFVRRGAVELVAEERVPETVGDVIAEGLVLAPVGDDGVHGGADGVGEFFEDDHAGVNLVIACVADRKGVADFLECLDGFEGCTDPEFQVSLAWDVWADLGGVGLGFGDEFDGCGLLFLGVYFQQSWLNVWDLLKLDCT